MATMMTRQHFERLADALQSGLGEANVTATQQRCIVEHLHVAFGRFNPRYDPQRFERAIGLPLED